jgi:hypothetical protein
MKKLSKNIKAEEIEYLKSNYGKIFGSEICKQLKWSSSKLERATRALGLKSKLQKRKNNANIELISKLEDPEILYILGYIWADGYIQRKKKIKNNKKIDNDFLFQMAKLTIVSEDFKDIENYFSKFGKYSIKHEKRGDFKPTSTWFLCDTTFCEWLCKFNYHEKSLKGPEKILNAIPENLRHYWWRGYFDGDGHIILATNFRSSVSISANFDYNWSFLNLFLNGIDFKINKITNKKGHKHSIASCNSFKSKKFLDYIYQNVEKDNIGLKRKRERYFLSKQYIFKDKKNKNKYVYYVERRNKWSLSIKKLGVQILFETEAEAIKKRDEIINNL